jgi:ERCC4-related helicase
VDEKEVYSHPEVNKPKEHIIPVEDEDVTKIHEILSKRRGEAMKWLDYQTRLNVRGIQFYKALTDLFSRAEAPEDLENIEEYFWLKKLNKYAREILAVDMVKQSLFSAVGFNQFKQKLEQVTDENNWFYLKNYGDVEEIFSILDRRIDESPESPKLKALDNLLKAEDIYYSKLKLEPDGEIINPSLKDKQKLIFTRLVDSAKNISRWLNLNDYTSVALAGAITSEDALVGYIDNFRKGNIPIMVSTDRYLQYGFDAPGAVVIDFDFSTNPSDREQRLARGRGGDTYTMVYKNTVEEKRIKIIDEEKERLKKRIVLV